MHEEVWENMSVPVAKTLCGDHWDIIQKPEWAVHKMLHVGCARQQKPHQTSSIPSALSETILLLGKEISELKNRGADASEIIDAIVSHICPNGGSIDEVSCRDSGTSALSEFMDQNPDADFGNLSDDQIWSLTAIYLGNEAFNRIQMDIGQAFEKQDVPYVERVTRLNDMREYIQSEIAIQMDALRKTADQNVDMNQLFQDTIKNTFEVFEVEV